MEKLGHLVGKEGDLDKVTDHYEEYPAHSGRD